MKTVTGIYTSAIIYHTNNPKTSIEPYALAQIQMLCDNPAFEGSKIRIMPDVHPGKAGTIGFTATVGKQILPQTVGIDIGCGITMARLSGKVRTDHSHKSAEHSTDTQITSIRKPSAAKTASMR